jgi:hypothetical protein
VISWIAPADNGSPIISYKIYIRKSDLSTFAIDKINCDGSLSAILNARQCTVPVTSLMSVPFSFNWGSSIYAKVVATNIYGDSLESSIGNGAILMTNPDAPINVAETISARTASTITFSWSPGPNNGGDVIIDYRVSYAYESDIYTVVAYGVTQTSYTVTGLTAGYFYKFRIEARNYLYYSSASVPV